MSLAAKLPYDHPYAGGFSGIGSQPLPTDTDALDYLSRMATADGAGVEVGVAVAVDAFFKDAKESGVFSALKACCILAGARTLAGALVPVVGDAPTPNGFVSGDYSRTDGLRDPGGTSYLVTGLGYNEVGANNEHLGVYLSSSPATNQNLLGGGTVSPASYSRIGYVSSQQTYEIQSGVGNSVGAPFAVGFVGAARESSASLTRRNGGVSATVSASSAATRSATTTKYAVFAANYSDLGTVGTTTAGLSFYSIGSSLDLAKLDTHVSAYVTAIGAAI